MSEIVTKSDKLSRRRALRRRVSSNLNNGVVEMTLTEFRRLTAPLAGDRYGQVVRGYTIARTAAAVGAAGRGGMRCHKKRHASNGVN